MSSLAGRAHTAILCISYCVHLCGCPQQPFLLSSMYKNVSTQCSLLLSVLLFFCENQGSCPRPHYGSLLYELVICYPQKSIGAYGTFLFPKFTVEVLYINVFSLYTESVRIRIVKCSIACHNTEAMLLGEKIVPRGGTMWWDRECLLLRNVPCEQRLAASCFIY